MYVIATPAFGSLAMTGGEKVTSYEIIIPAFTRFTMTKKEKITHQAEHTIHSPLWIFFLSLGASPPLVHVRNAHFFVIARSEATKQYHPILPTVFFTVVYVIWYTSLRAIEYVIAIHC